MNIAKIINFLIITKIRVTKYSYLTSCNTTGSSMNIFFQLFCNCWAYATMPFQEGRSTQRRIWIAHFMCRKGLFQIGLMRFGLKNASRHVSWRPPECSIETMTGEL